MDKHKNHIYMIEEDQNVENDIDRKHPESSSTRTF